LPDRQARDDEVGISNRPMPLPFVISAATTAVIPTRMREILEFVVMPDRRFDRQ
jgi:hypothetical protein